jgi:hypothetical protein
MLQTPRLGWAGGRVAQKVNGPEIGRASRPIRNQLVVLGGDEDNIIIVSNFIPVVFGYLLGQSEICIPKSSYVRW